MTVQVRASVDLVGVPPERAFAAMVDLAAQQRWMIATRLFPVESTAPVPQVGSRVAAFSGVCGLGFLDTMTVTVYDPPQRWVVAKDGRLLRGVGTMQVDPLPGGSRATWMNELDPPFGALGRLGARLGRPVAAAVLRACLRRLARQLRSGALPLDAADHGLVGAERGLGAADRALGRAGRDGRVDQ
ncbi:MAG TPA: SRPBCC family protein [Nakamurella sp.]